MYLKKSEGFFERMNKNPSKEGSEKIKKRTKTHNNN
jgi:hypothetical protein